MAKLPWIPVGTGTPRCEELVRIASKAGKSRRETFAILVEFWIWVTEQTSDGILSGYTLDGLRIAIDGTDAKFWNAVRDEQWIVVRDDGLFVPDNKSHPFISKGGRARMLKSQRQANWRESSTDVDGAVDVYVDGGGDENAPRSGPFLTATDTYTDSITKPADRKRSVGNRTAPHSAGLEVSEPDKTWHHAERLARRLGVPMQDFDFGHRIAALIVAGKLSDRFVAECAAEAKTQSNGSPMGLFRTKLRAAGKAAKIRVDELAKSVRFPAEYYRGPPGPVPEIALLANALSSMEDA